MDVEAPVAQRHAEDLAASSINPISAAFDSFAELSKVLKGVAEQTFDQFVPEELGEPAAEDDRIEEKKSEAVDAAAGEEEDAPEEEISPEIPLYQTFWAFAIADYMQTQKVKYDEFLREFQIEKRGEEVHDVVANRVPKKLRLDESVKGALVGDARVRRMREIYTRGFRVRVTNGEDDSAFRYITPSDDQLLFLESCLFACLPKIYGEHEWATNYTQILKEWKRDEIDYFLMMITARRVGKTTSMSMFDAAFLLVVPGRTISVFSTGKRASKALKELVEKFIGMTGEENKKRIINSNQEELFIAHKVVSEVSSKRSQESQDLRMDPTTAKLFSYPSTVKGKHQYRYMHIHNPPDSASLSMEAAVAKAA